MYYFYTTLNILGIYKLHVLIFRSPDFVDLIYVTILYVVFMTVTIIYLEIWNGKLFNIVHLTQHCFHDMESFVFSYEV